MREIITFFKILFLSILSLSSMAMSEVDLNLDKIVSETNSTHNHVMLFLHKDGCGFCERMLFDLEGEKLSAIIKKSFILVDINKDDDETISFQGYTGSNRKFLKKLDVDLYPTVIFLDQNSSFIYNTIGYRNPKKFTTMLNYISNSAYKKTTFEEFEDESFTDEEE